MLKTSQPTTMITVREACPPNFQFMTNTQSDEGMQIGIESVLLMHNIVEKFGLSKEISCPVSLGANEKGGMEDEEFTEYLRTAIMPLCPTAENGKWVILKCDSSPGHRNIQLLADLRDSGFALLSGVPNNNSHYPRDRPKLWSIEGYLLK